MPKPANWVTNKCAWIKNWELNKWLQLRDCMCKEYGYN